MIPRATYRLQFRNGMDFAKAIEIVPYLQKLGISHLYASPLYAAVAGSTHGYDVIDNNVIDPALGGMDGLLALAATLNKAGMGLIVDIVPNHMAASLQNPWWNDVVEWGATSSYANHFDIDWRRKLTLPILASTYVDALTAGELTIRLDERSGALALGYFDNLLPLHPKTYDGVLSSIDDPLAREIAASAAMASPSNRAWKEKLRLIARSESLGKLQRELEAISRDRSRIDRLHELQPWRLIGWRDAGRKLSYRRFFEIAGLVGLRVEDRQVFDALHELTLSLVRNGVVQGLRIDHVDGLTDPQKYLTWLRAAVGPDLYIVVEKILAEDEELPSGWPVQGTTGYEFIPALAKVFIEGAGRARLENAYRAERPHRTDLESERYEAKRLIVENNFAGELGRLVDLVLTVESAIAPGDVRQIISELIAAFPVYRTYGDSDGMNAGDRLRIDKVADAVKRAGKGIDSGLLDRLVLLLVEGKGEAAGELRQRFQQLSSAVMAKSVEDTLFYRWHAFIAVNEVGSDPALQIDDSWHDAMARRTVHHPYSLLATATHDTKRGEDSRARLYSLSERSEEWLYLLSRWRQLAAGEGDGLAPDTEFEWLVYQSLASIWPSEDVQDANLSTRFLQFLEKAMREAKLHTSWTDVNAEYERVGLDFIEKLLRRENEIFPDGFTTTLRPYICAGWINSLSQTLLKLTVPGIPDIYQGSELGDFSLVDPDNRRPVDFSFLAENLDRPLIATDRDHLSDGRVKQRLIAAALDLRRRKPDLFALGTYEPLKVSGARAEQVIAYLRRQGHSAIIVIVPRLTFGLAWPASYADFWADTHVLLPNGLPSFSDVLGGSAIRSGDDIRLIEQLALWPVGLLAGTSPLE